MLKIYKVDAEMCNSHCDAIPENERKEFPSQYWDSRLSGEFPMKVYIKDGSVDLAVQEVYVVPRRFTLVRA
ncbi:hypothetical protein Leryth_016093 [Lithospermum erythrorhizon]|nr:hypothetical protein Leryth_016093 [Lithospermum erythrorhizon]